MSRKSKSVVKKFAPMILVCYLSWAAYAQSVCQCISAGISETTRPGANELITIIESKLRKSIFGIANDVNGQSLKGVLVEVFAISTKNADDAQKKRILACTTDGGGRFCFKNVPSGKYEVLYSLEGGWKQTSLSVVVASNRSKVVNRKIEI
jgi:hypothetical protein